MVAERMNLRETAAWAVMVLLLGSIIVAAEESDQSIEAVFGINVGESKGMFHTGSALGWNMTCGGAGSDFAVDLVQTTDGGYALVGSTESFGAGNTDVWLVKTDAFGNHLWNKTYGGTGVDYANVLVQTTDGGYAFAGHTYSGVSKDAWLVRIDASGNHLWNRTYGGVSEDRAYALVQTTDGGYALACSTDSSGAGRSDFWLVKTSIDGSHEWNKTYGGTSIDDPLAMVQTVDGGYALTGRTGSFGAGSTDFWLVKTDANGNHLWNRTYGGVSEDRAYALVQTTDGGYALTGPTYSFGVGNGDGWLVKTDASGYHLWNRTYGGSGVDWFYSVIIASDGGYALTGPTSSYGAGSSDVWLVETDALGNAERNQTYGGTGQDYAGSLIQTSDGGHALAGGTKSFGAGSDDLWLVKTMRGISAIIVPDDYSTIQEAINEALDGDTIFVKAGTYYEHVVVNKTVSLLGEDVSMAIVDGSATGNVFAIEKNSINITGFTVRNGGGVLGNAGLRLDNVSFCSISGNRIRDNFAGIWFEGSSKNLITANEIAANVDDGIVFNYSHNNTISENQIALHEYFGIVINWSLNNTICYNNVTQTHGPSHGDGINLWRSSYNNIFQNRVEENTRYGIRIEVQSNNNTLSDNTIRNCTTGLQVYDSSSFNLVYENGITECTDGIDVKNSGYTEIFNNTVAHNYGSDWNAGVRLESASYAAIRDNEIFDNWRGILLYASSPYVSICGNNVTSNEYGIRVAMGGSNYVNISGNYVASNRGYGIDVTGFGGLGESNYATIARNLIVNNTFEAVGLGTGSSYNTVVQNDMIGNGHAGVTLERYSNYNTVVQNNIIGNAYGICFDLYVVNSTQNTITNNNIIDNTQQVRIAPGSVNAWNGSYASGGNYWSDYSGLDQFSGPYQNLTGSDGIGDTPFVIDGNNIDRYPLMTPWTEVSSLIGDVNADGKVDMKDVGYVARRFMCVPGDPLWDVNADFNSDGKINMVDIGTVARHFGESLP